MKYEHDIRAIRRVDGNVSYWIAKSQQLPGCLGRGSSVEEAIQNLIDPKGNTNGAKGLSDDTLRSLRIEDESDSEKHQGLAEKLQEGRARAPGAPSAAIAKTMASRTAATETADTV